MVLEAKQTTLEFLYPQSAVIHGPVMFWLGITRCYIDVTNLNLHNAENALDFGGTNDMRYYNFWCRHLWTGR